MGFFSSDCEGCGHPLLAAHVTNSINHWMNYGVAIHPNGTIVTGSYDGYGSLVDENEEEQQAAGWESGITVWHQACWQVAGRPPENRGESRSAADQGYFFDDPDHDMTEPAWVPEPAVQAATQAMKFAAQGEVRAATNRTEGVAMSAAEAYDNDPEKWDLEHEVRELEQQLKAARQKLTDLYHKHAQKGAQVAEQSK